MNDRTPDLQDLTAQVRAIEEQNHRLFRQLLSEEQRLRSLVRSAWRVQEEERRRLAGELHDGLGQTLTALKIQLERQARRAEDAAPAVAEELRRSAEFAGSALAEARRLSHQLRPQVLDDLGLAAALRWLARTLSEGTGFEVRLTLDGLEPTAEEDLDPELTTVLFRVAQEALTNALKHSRAEAAEVEAGLDGQRRRLRLVVRDQGTGFDPAAPASDRTSPPGSPGQGLRGMRDRVTLFGGRLVVHSAPGEGTEVQAELPL